jgi:hypothetical protein
MKLRDISAFAYRGLIMARHPEAIGLRRRGIDYEHYRNLRRPWLLDAGIKTILDIGANTGQFARLAHEVFPGASIYSFEPLPDCFETLKTALPAGSDFHPHQLRARPRRGHARIPPGAAHAVLFVPEDDEAA